MSSSPLARSSLVIALFLSALLLVSSSRAQGDLTPPGPPAATMKKLDEVEPRTNLQGTPAPAGVVTTDNNYHFIINQPGSYYLSANLAVTKPNGIRIVAEGVTLDLNGFEISRSSGGVGNGIEITSTSHRASVRNGSLKGFANGLFSSDNAEGSILRDLSVSRCTDTGIRAGQGAVLDGCRAHNNTGDAGIATAEGSSLANCVATANEVDHGIFAGSGSSLTNCTAYGNFSEATRSAGIGTGGRSTIRQCTASTNVSNATTFTPTTGMGFDVGVSSTIEGCTANANKGDGIRIGSNSTARDNNCDLNGGAGDGAGIHATGNDTRIEANNVVENDRGIDVDAAGNLIIKNSASGNTINYEIAAGNRYGEILNLTAGGTASVSGNSATGTLTSGPNAWANFSY